MYEIVKLETLLKLAESVYTVETDVLDGIYATLAARRHMLELANNDYIKLIKTPGYALLKMGMVRKDLELLKKESDWGLQLEFVQRLQQARLQWTRRRASSSGTSGTPPS